MEDVSSDILKLRPVVFNYTVGTDKSEQTGLIAAALYSMLPYSVYYSRVMLPEVPLVFFILLTIYLFDRALAARPKNLAILFKINK